MLRIKENKNCIIYTLCFVLLCIVNFIVGSQPGRIQFIAVNSVGFILAIVILAKYRVTDFFKPIYAVWSVISVLIGAYALYWGYNNYLYLGRWITAVFNVWIYGYIVIRIVFSLKDKKYAPVSWIPFLTWVAVTVVMVCSRNSRVWPLWYGLIFGCFFLTEYSREDLKDLAKGLVNGVVISFFLIQGYAFAFRPYDVARYSGAFLNPNINSLFYVTVYAGLLCKFFSSVTKHAHLGIRVLWFTLSASIFGFITLSGSRTAYVAMAAITVPFIVCLFFSCRKIIRCFVLLPIVFGIVAIVSIPVDYLAVRYLPAVHLHPVYYEGEWSSEKVQPGEARDSEKYVSMAEMLKYNVGRMAWFIDFNKLFPEKKVDKKIEEPVAESAESQEKIVAELSLLDLTDPSYDKSLLLEKKGENVGPIGVRFRIARWFFEHLNLRGHDIDEEGVWYAEDYYVTHAHNWLIMMSYSYGIPAGLLYVVMLFFYLKAFIRLIKNKDLESATIIGCFITAFFAFGLFETTWSQGQMPFILFFILYRYIVDKRYVWDNNPTRHIFKRD